MQKSNPTSTSNSLDGNLRKSCRLRRQKMNSLPFRSSAARALKILKFKEMTSGSNLSVPTQTSGIWGFKWSLEIFLSALTNMAIGTNQLLSKLTNSQGRQMLKGIQSHALWLHFAFLMKMVRKLTQMAANTQVTAKNLIDPTLWRPATSKSWNPAPTITYRLVWRRWAMMSM